MKFAIKVLPKPEVLDTQGRAVAETFTRHGFDVKGCQVGRYIVLDVEGQTREEARANATAMIKKGLYNPLIENFEMEEIK